MTAGLYVQYGCGTCAPQNWTNFDASPRLALERLPGLGQVMRALGKRIFPENVKLADIVKGLPLPDMSASAAYCSHVLEHLPRDDVPTALRNTFRLLQPGGVFRIVVPDLRWRATRYVRRADEGAERAADEFIQSCLIGKQSRPRGLVALLRSQYGNSHHFWMYDFEALKRLLLEAGFTSIRRCGFGDAADPMFALVEEATRFSEQGELELAVEARRPEAH